MSDEGLELVAAGSGVLVLEGRSDLRDLVNFHGDASILTIRIIHMVENEINGTLRVEVALAETTFGLFLAQSHASNHHESLSVVYDSSSSATRSTSLRFAGERILQARIFHVAEEPIHSCVNFAGRSSFIDGPLGGEFRGTSTLHELVDQIHVYINLHFFNWEADFTLLELAVGSEVRLKVDLLVFGKSKLDI